MYYLGFIFLSSNLNTKLQPNKVLMLKLSAQKWQTNGSIACYSQQIRYFKNRLEKNSHWVKEQELHGGVIHNGLGCHGGWRGDKCCLCVEETGRGELFA